MDRFLKLLYAMCLTALLCGDGLAQAKGDADPTLHVYVNRMQIPVLVLSEYGRPLKPIPPSNFSVNLEGVGTFKPSRVRLEGDDPLAVAVIVDASDPYETMWRDLPKAVAKLLPLLNPQDRLTLYGLDGCKAYRFLPEDAAWNATTVGAGVDLALAMKAHVAVKGREDGCKSGLKLADLLSHVAVKLSRFPGRRMIVPVGGGSTSGVAGSMDTLRQLLISESVVVMPVVHDGAYAAMPVPYQPRRGMPVAVVNTGFGGGYAALAELSEFSGGRVRYIASHEFAAALAETVTTARGRYILEFPRPDKLVAGHYRIFVTDGHVRDFIRTSGVSVPVANAEEVAAAQAQAALRKSGADGAGAAAPASADVTSAPVVSAPAAAEPPPVPAVLPAPAALAAPAPATPAVAAPPAPIVPDPTDITGDFQPAR